MTTEKNETPAAAEKPKNLWACLDSPPKEPERDDDVLRMKDVSVSWLTSYILKRGCFTLLVIVTLLIGSCSVLSIFEEDAYKLKWRASECISNLSQIGKGLHYGLTHPDDLPESMPRDAKMIEITPDMMVADLLQEVLRRGILDPGQNGKYLRCAQSGDPFLVLPVPASALFLDSRDRIPIAMDPPDAHHVDNKLLMTIYRLLYPHCAEYALTARVLYSDGSVGVISREEAEKLVMEQSPVPIEF